MKKNFSIVRVLLGVALVLLIVLFLSGYLPLLFGFAWFMIMSNPLAPHIVSGAILSYLLLRVIFSGLQNVHFYGVPLVLSAILWSLYGMYESGMQTSDPGANIRIDMLIIIPLLFGAPILAIMRDVRHSKASREKLPE